MLTEILDYRYTTEWNLDILKDETFKANLEPKFPLITSSISNRELNSIENCWNDYTRGKLQGRPRDVLDAFPGGFSRRIGDYLGLSGESILINASCASGLYAFHIGSMHSLASQTPVVVVCADNVMHPFDLWRFSSIGALHNETGRPFDKSSRGFKMGTGITAFLIKHPSVKSNIAPVATITNTAFYTNNVLMTGPGDADDIINNLPGIDYKSIDFWNAHATGTPVGDAVEYSIFEKTVKQDIPIVSFKGYIGHCICASGTMEVAMALDGKKNNILLPNKIEGEKIVNDDRIITEQTSFPYKRMLKANLGFGGRTAVAVIDLY